MKKDLANNANTNSPSKVNSKSANLRELIKGEYLKCINDPIYFMKKYIRVQNPIKGTCLFDLYPFQEDALRTITQNNRIIILKARQMGISTLAAGYSIWLMNFFQDKNILCISITQETAKEIVTRVRFAHSHLPTWLKVQETENNRLSLRLKNGSQIKAVSSSTTAGRSSALSLLIIDECAYIDNIQEIWTSSQPTLSTGGKAIILSCVTDDTFIFTDQGIKQVKDFIPSKINGDYKINTYSILGKDKLRTGNLFHNNGFQKTNIIDSNFSKLECTDNHKIWAFSDKDFKNNNSSYFLSNVCWTESKYLEVNDFIPIQYGMNVWGNYNSINTNNKNLLNTFSITPELAYVFGLYISTGKCSKVLLNNAKNKCLGETISVYSKNNIFYILNKLKSLQYTYKDNTYTFFGKRIIDLFEAVGFNLDSNIKIIPSKLLEMPKNLIINLLRGLFDNNSTITKKGNIIYKTQSEILINQVRILLNNIGIISSIYKNNSAKSIYSLHINDKFAIAYYNLIGFSNKQLQNKIKLLYINLNDNSDIIPYGYDLIADIIQVSNISIKNASKLCGINLTKYFNKNKSKKKEIHASREDVIIIYNTFKNLLPLSIIKHLDNIINTNVYWCKIKSIKKSENYTFDFSLPNDNNDFWCHSVIYNGIIGHQTPNGIANFFHKTWCDAETGENDFVPIKMPWYLHPDRNQEWRNKQTEENGVKKAAQENDCEFLTTGDQVINLTILNEYTNKYIKDPIEKRGIKNDFWVWERSIISKNYIVSADCSRGDGSDYSAFHVFNLENMEQVAEYKGKLTTKDYGNLLVAISTEYNDALLVIENNNIGWATIQQVIDRGYKNLFYSTSDLSIVDVEHTYTNKLNTLNKKLTPGFCTTTKNRPLLISNIDTLINNREVIFHSKRLIDELSTFIWKNGKAEAMIGYNDDLVMSFSIGLWIRDTALRLKNEQQYYNKNLLSKISNSTVYVNRSSNSNLNKGNDLLFNKDRAKSSWNMTANNSEYNKDINKGAFFNLEELL